MKTTGLNNSFLLVSIRRIGRGFLALFRFTEADVCALLSAYGGYALEIDRLQNNPPISQKGGRGKLAETSLRKRIGAPSGPIPIGVHPDFTLAKWMNGSRKQVCRPCKVAKRSQDWSIGGMTPHIATGGNCPPKRFRPPIMPADMRSEHSITPKGGRDQWSF
jgi:hypothetical protein